MNLYLYNIPLKRKFWVSNDEMENLEFFWNAKNEYYTLMIYDIDAPYPDRNTSSPYVHLLITNIPGNQIRQGSFILPFVKPNPPLKSHNHRFIVSLFEQNNIINNINSNNRSKFDLGGFIKHNGLHLLDDEILEIDPQHKEFFLRSKEDDPLDPVHPLLIPNADLSEQEKKFCDCIEKVSVKQPLSCLTDKDWYGYREGKQCADPYKVCAKSVGTTSRKCTENYNFDEWTDKQKQSYAALHNKPIPKPMKY